MKTNQSSAFTLVEVAIALGVASFCLVSVFGLLPIGLNSNQASVQQTIAAGLASTVVADLRATPITSGTSPQFSFTIPTSNGTNTMLPNSPDSHNTKFFAEGGMALSSAIVAGTTARFRVTVGFAPPVISGTTRMATAARVLITWPALADQATDQWPSKFSGSFETVTVLDRN